MKIFWVEMEEEGRVEKGSGDTAVRVSSAQRGED